MARVKYYDPVSEEWKYADVAFGTKGEPGEDGKDGHTPQKGVDYFTEEDKQEMLQYLMNEGTLTYNEQELTEDQKVQVRENIGAMAAKDVIPLSQGGTGSSVDLDSAPANAIIRKLTNETYNQLYYTATGNGAFYATSANGVPKFGTLPIAQGGTDATTAEGIKQNLGISPFVTSFYIVGPSSKLRIAIEGSLMMIGRKSGASDSVAVYAFSGYSLNREPNVQMLSEGTSIVVSTGGSNDNGWYIDIMNTSGNDAIVYFFGQVSPVIK